MTCLYSFASSTASFRRRALSSVSFAVSAAALLASRCLPASYDRFPFLPEYHILWHNGLRSFHRETC